MQPCYSQEHLAQPSPTRGVLVLRQGQSCPPACKMPCFCAAPANTSLQREESMHMSALATGATGSPGRGAPLSHCVRHDAAGLLTVVTARSCDEVSGFLSALLLADNLRCRIPRGAVWACAKPAV